MSRLPVIINPEVFKVKDPRVSRLLNAQLSAEAFAMGLTSRDPFVMVGSQIYVYTEVEFYAMRSALPANEADDAAFEKLLALEDLSFMHQLDRTFVEDVKKKAKGCSGCQRRRYKAELYKLAKKYNIDLDNVPGNATTRQPDSAEYPETSSPILQNVPEAALIVNTPKRPVTVRKDCIDCVEKHVSQAWVLGNEVLMGYPEHLPLVTAHLREALEELPKNAQVLVDTLSFCLARTNYTNSPFVPLALILPAITALRGSMRQSLDDQQDNVAKERAKVMEIELTDEMREELRHIPVSLLSAMEHDLKYVTTLTRDFKELEANHTRAAWQGTLAVLADRVVTQAPKFANMIRNRRMLFVANPGLALECGYDFQELFDIVKSAKDNTISNA